MSAPRLLILAAGLGSRFGGSKQIDPVGPEGSWIMDYAVVDAVRNGFDHVVCVVRPEIRESVRAHLTALLDGRAGLTLVDQTLDAALPTGFEAAHERTKPWGTAHAVLVAESALPGPFAVANADDVYGHESVACLARAMRDEPGWYLVGYPLGETLSPHGSVNRGLCRADADGWLHHVEEVLDIAKGRDGGVRGTGPDGPVGLREDELISMNLWGLDATVFPVLRQAFAEFLSDPARRARGELALPDAVGSAVTRGEARIRLLPCGRGWVGMTHGSDRDRVQRSLEALGRPVLEGFP